MNYEFRRKLLATLANLLESNESAILDALFLDLRKNPQEAYASELGFVTAEIRHAMSKLRSWMKPEVRRTPWMAWPAKSAIRAQPYGVVLIIGPWNYPLGLLLSPLVGAIAAGNCAVLKPSEIAPHTSELLTRLIGEAFPQDVIAIVPGGREISEELLEMSFDKFFFTGSTEIGRKVMQAAAQKLTPVTLELGGKCPCIVCDDAPLEIAARRIVWGKFLNAGQTCVAPDYVLVDAKIREKFIDVLKITIKQFFGENPKQSTDFGRIINARHFARVAAYLTEGEIIYGGEKDESDLFLSPTLLLPSEENASVMREEIFGPILPIVAFSDLNDVLEKWQSVPKPLALYLFTCDKEIQERVLANTQSGGVCINDTVMQILGRDLPFGGVGESGLGQYHGKASFDCFSHPRTVMIRSTAFDPAFRYPPMKTSLAALKRILRYFG